MSVIGLKIKTLLLGSLFVPAVFASAAVSAASDSPWQDGAHVYAKICSHCHETKGDIGPVLAGRSLPPTYIAFIVRNGFRAMPAFPASFVDDEALQQVGEYIQKLPAKAKE
ncbi:MAG: cytochrome c [Pseudomonas sp.]|jgi:mono/diheme cytochrome c family protein|nr:cytochrome c [Pseudomonas sp.]MDD2222794.1 cytochrome c [Pseudomonas sp.]MDY0413911.1 cytochrome c [Pseudomonas sp.]NLO55327.1 cytochrome c [Gammaproteobacteria bacterium]